MLLGNVDAADRFAVSGWATEPDLGEISLGVTINVDDRSVAEVRCDFPRADVGAVLGHANGRCGFVHRFDPPLSNDMDHKIVVKLANTGELLPNGERSVAAVAMALQEKQPEYSASAIPASSGLLAMDRALSAALFALPPLDHGNPARQSVPCKICGKPSNPFDVVDLNKVASIEGYYDFGFADIAIRYHRCGYCGFLFTRFFDSWTAEEFGEFIYNSDYVKADPEYSGTRPLRTAEQMTILAQCREARILDYGSGGGEFEEAMRARGFGSIESYDPFSHPVRPSGTFDLITCVEVIEHTLSPVRAIADMRSFLKEGGAILFTQNLQPADIERIRCSWWYIAPRNGHVSTFTARTLAIVGEQTGMVFHRGDGLHALRDPNPSTFSTRAVGAIGPPFVAARLAANSAVSPAECWHGPEGLPERRYRWTAAPEIGWMVTLPLKGTCTLQVEVPFLHEVDSCFAENCRIAFDGIEESCRVEGRRLVAESRTSSEGVVLVTLRTPPPRSPAELRGTPDDRLLGLAIAMD